MWSVEAGPILPSAALLAPAGLPTPGPDFVSSFKLGQATGRKLHAPVRFGTGFGADSEPRYLSAVQPMACGIDGVCELSRSAADIKVVL